MRTRDDIRAALTDEQALTATLLGECAGEPIAGQIAVAQVIRNRMLHPRWWGGPDARSVCLKPDQFACWWESGANTRAVYDVADALIERQPVGERSGLAQLRWIAQGVLGDQLVDVSKTSDHYLTVALWQSPLCPTWARGKSPVAVWHRHAFFRLEI